MIQDRLPKSDLHEDHKVRSRNAKVAIVVGATSSEGCPVLPCNDQMSCWSWVDAWPVVSVSLRHCSLSRVDFSRTQRRQFSPKLGRVPFLTLNVPHFFSVSSLSLTFLPLISPKNSLGSAVGGQGMSVCRRRVLCSPNLIWQSWMVTIFIRLVTFHLGKPWSGSPQGGQKLGPQTHDYNSVKS